jgi:lysophospholipase L1-like esterase
MATYRPDLVMIQLGVNDAWGGRANDAILASCTTLVQQARAQNPNVVIAVAQIQKIRQKRSTVCIPTMPEHGASARPVPIRLVWRRRSE